MKPFINFLFFTITAFFLSSCEDVVQIKLDEGSKLYVIDAFVNDLDGIQTIRVVTNDTYFSNREAPPVSGAQVILKDLTASKQFLFSDVGNGNYVYNTNGNDTIAKIGHQYELNVTIDGDTYTSLAIQKRTAGLDSIRAEYNDGDNGFGPPEDPFYFCSLWAKDKVDNNTDYYWVKTFRNDTLFSGTGDINVCIDGTGGAVTEGDLDSNYFTPPATFLGFKRYQRGNTCKVEIHSISHDTYFFFLQAQAQINNGGLFATTPENVKTNIVAPAGAKTKAVGWFNMASVATKSKLIP
ncbi:DUF4249 family protein [Aurantibacillus circumpalustris]|uniref:DUF4249 family protein n=1 Tax=Aurantibacillus circumpalustris TaxID=3036359 RepID=UPI00295B690A|nr:DUF4249 family protein [Aurantibacillus circumpalustris]